LEGEMMKRSPEMEKFVNGFTQSAFGRTMKEPVCVFCGSPLIKSEDFRDDLSRQEFEISHLCQKCQNDVFG